MSENLHLPANKHRLINISCFLIWFVYLCMQTGLLWWMDWNMDGVINDSLISASVLAGLAFVFSHALNAYLPSGKMYVPLILSILVLGVVSVYASRWLLYTTISDGAYLSTLNHSIPVRFCFQILLLAWVAAINMRWNLQEEREENERRRLEVEKMTREAELYNLRQQLQPHFLFNSLNSIMALIDLQPEKAQEMIVSLSAFLRGTLRVDPLQSSSLREEMQQLERYLEIEKVRFGHRLEVKKSLTDAALTAHLPNMILQPLLENAIKFSLYNHSGSVSINLQAFVDEHDQLCLSIQNPYKPEGETRQRGTGFGIRGVKRRLFLLFGRTDLLETFKDGQHFQCTLRIPQREYPEGYDL